MHTAESRRDGETSERLDRLVVWRHVDDFSEREKAALAWTEALTNLDPTADQTALKRRLAEHFSDSEIAALTAQIGLINLWNHLMVATHQPCSTPATPPLLNRRRRSFWAANTQSV